MNHALLDLILAGLRDAIADKDKQGFGDNQARSAHFVSCFASRLHDGSLGPGCDLKVISVDNWGKKSSGEWLLDIALVRSITIEEKGYRTAAIIDIEWAVESESNSAVAEFARDFSKLAVVRARNYLYLHGFNQGTERAARQYFERRLGLAVDILRKVNGFPQSFYLAFWPSPEKPSFGRSVNSIWDLLAPKADKKYQHLAQVHLYRLESSGPTFLGAGGL